MKPKLQIVEENFNAFDWWVHSHHGMLWARNKRDKEWKLDWTGFNSDNYYVENSLHAMFIMAIVDGKSVSRCGPTKEEWHKCPSTKEDVLRYGLSKNFIYKIDA